jgi:toxin CcdB
MAQFDVYENTDPTSQEFIPFLLDVQHNLHQSLSTRTVVPLVRTRFLKENLEKLSPVLTVNGEEVLMSTPELAGYPVRDLGAKVASLSDERITIFSAIDFLLSGF